MDEKLDWHTQYQFELERADRLEAALAASRKEVRKLKKEIHGTHKLTRLQAAIVSAYTGYLACSFQDMHDYAEQLMGRKISELEFSTDSFINELREAAKPDFLEIAFEEQK